MALPCVRLGSVRLRSGVVLRSLCRSSSLQAAAAPEEVDIPKKKTWDKTAVLQALAYTVNHDPTSSSYIFQDDPYLTPKSSADYIVFSKSKESGRNAAQYVVNMYPNLFEKMIPEPHIPCLMPENTKPQIEGISEEALIERIQLRKLKDSVNLYDQLLQAGTPPSLQTTNRLLDLLCFYGDKEPATESQTNQEQESENEINRKTPDLQNLPEVKRWRDNNNAERIFNLMPEKDEHSYRTMIRGMVKHGAATKAFDMYTDLLNNRLTGDVYTFNALITAAPRVKSESKEKWALIVDLLNQMIHQKVKPNLLTFNAILSSLRKTGLKGIALQTLNEMKALNIVDVTSDITFSFLEPSLATFNHLLALFYKPGYSSNQAEVLEQILHVIQGKSFTAQDPDDVKFFAEAIRVCLETKDLELAYKLDALKNVADNWKLLGSRTLQTYYYSKFFSLICMLENLDVVLKWYRENIPSRYFPHVKSLVDLLQVIEMENRMELIPQIWKGNPNLQAEFAEIATTMKTILESNTRTSQQMSATILGDITILLCRGGRMEEVWPHVVEECLGCATTSKNTSMAINLVQLAVNYSLPNTAKLAQIVLDELTLTEEQRLTLEDLTQSSSSSSSSDSDQE
uniref:Small ribosomal subunit protein mS39 n=1 Tax=Pyxicephalus adspersus TaxID=30357 RepID=A0AAV3ADP0_PYXAD|nr:TPA: hypothetical protein GDO54_009639 [Pyxicephalus adspersus]